jgi:hypothetical protein
MNIGSITWPEDPRTACNHYLEYILQVITRIGIAFPDMRPDPLIVARRYLDSDISEVEYKTEAEAWWDSLYATGQITTIRNPDVFLMRLAICVLSVTPDEAPRLGEHLSWFLELLERMGIDLREPRAMMARHFAWPHSPSG